MSSPYVRRLRLGNELRTLRDQRNMTQARVARAIGKTRNDISKLENAQTIDFAAVLNLLDALGAEDASWAELMALARDASAPGWWDSVKNIGTRQALYANLEWGAKTIREYHQTALPGLLQIPDYVRSLAIAGAALEPASGAVEGLLAGRIGRQRFLRRPGGPSVEMILDEFAVMRLAVPVDVTKQQLRHLAEVVKGGQPSATLRVLPAHARIRDFMLPRSAFFMYTYPDPKDPRVVAIDTVTSDVILTDEAQIAPYERIWERIREAALTAEESAKFLTEAADALPDT
jgi:transcriptional regulator with XRE-family HTH domain